MKRRKFLKHLNQCGCVLYREGGRHSIYINPNDQTTSPVPVPRHPTIKRTLCIIICKQLKIISPF